MPTANGQHAINVTLFINSRTAVPNKIYIAVTISLVVLTAVVTAWIVGARASGDGGRELAFRVNMQCDSWARELERAAEAYEAHARAPGSVDLPLGDSHRERSRLMSRVMNEQKFCLFVRTREAQGTDPGMRELDDAGGLFVDSRRGEPALLAQAIRRLADAAKRNATLEIGP